MGQITDNETDPWRASPPQEDGDLPPSYDSSFATGSASAPATSHPATGGDAAPDEDRSYPKNLQWLFSGPTNAEPLLGTESRDIAARERVKRIETSKRGSHLESWDPKLANPDALYDFIRVQAMEPPKIFVRCAGRHRETCEHAMTVWENGVSVRKRQGEIRTVEDFNFTIDLSSIINHPENNAHIHLSSADPWVPTYRGSHRKTYAASFAPVIHRSRRHRHHAGGEAYQTLLSEDGNGELAHSAVEPGRSPTRAEQKEWDAWTTYRNNKGIPRWVRMDEVPDWRAGQKGKQRQGAGTTAPSATGAETGPIRLEEEGRDVEQGRPSAEGERKADLKEWCRAFCADKGLLKEFVLSKGTRGWDVEGLRSAITDAIVSTGYPAENLFVSIDSGCDSVVVRSNNWLSRSLGNGFIYFLAWITLLYPLIWIWQRLHPLGGAPWNVALVSYSLKTYPPLPSTFPNETLSAAQSRLPALYKLHPELPQDPQLQYGPKGVHYLLGRKEGEWFREWEERIRMGVRTRFSGELQGGVVAGSSRAIHLDGYAP
ncbi:hypothetical protein IAT38_003767 [Cryptococcus sp. DSM 104549]